MKSGNGTHAITDDARSALAKIATSTIVAGAEASSAPTEIGSPTEKVTAVVIETTTPSSPEADAPASVTVEVLPVHHPDAGTPAPAADGATSPEGVSAAEPASIVDIPVVAQPKTPRKLSEQDAELILDSVLDALPAPKEPGQGRARRSRRASSAGTVTAAPEGEA